jgi:hypothetical protein
MSNQIYDKDIKLNEFLTQYDAFTAQKIINKNKQQFLLNYTVPSGYDPVIYKYYIVKLLCKYTLQNNTNFDNIKDNIKKIYAFLRYFKKTTLRHFFAIAAGYSNVDKSDNPKPPKTDEEYTREYYSRKDIDDLDTEGYLELMARLCAVAELIDNNMSDPKQTIGGASLGKYTNIFGKNGIITDVKDKIDQWNPKMTPFVFETPIPRDPSSYTGSTGLAGSTSGSTGLAGSTPCATTYLPKNCDTYYGLQITKFKDKNCSGTKIDQIIQEMCKTQKGDYFGVGGTTPADMAKMLITGGADFVNPITMDTKNYTNTLIDTLNKLIKLVQEKGMVIDSTDATRLNTLMTQFSDIEKEVITDIQKLYKLYENSKHLSKDTLKTDTDGKTPIPDFELKPLGGITDAELNVLTTKLAEYKKMEGKLLLTCDKLLFCLKNP